MSSIALVLKFGNHPEKIFLNTATVTAFQMSELVSEDPLGMGF